MPFPVRLRSKALKMGLANSSASDTQGFGEEQEVMDFGHAFMW